MIRAIFCCFLCIVSLQASQTTKEKIKSTTKDLKTAEFKEKELSNKIDELANQIVKEQNSVKQIQKNINNLTGLIVGLKEKYQNEEKELEKLNSQNKVLINSKKNIEERIIKIITEDLAFDLISDEQDIKTTQSIIATEVLDSLSNITLNELDKLVKDYEDTSRQILNQGKKIDQIKSNLKDYNNKKTELWENQKKQENTIASLKKNKDQYAKRLEKLNDEQEEIRKTLEQLKIIDDKEERLKAKKAEEKRLAAEKKKQKDSSKTKFEDDNENEEVVIDDARVAKVSNKVKQYGSSYQASRVKKYTGTKTIPPLAGAYVKRKFGNYTDPVYNIKIFNESIVLGSKSADTQVKSVLAGKVLFAKETAVLDKVVIIEHANGIHTIYAHMNQIAPTIKVGSTIKKGYIIGRISEDLTFEVTQKNYHINPLELISLK